VHHGHLIINLELHVAVVVENDAMIAAANKIGSWNDHVASAGYIASPELIASSNADGWRETFEVGSLRHAVVSWADAVLDQINVKGSYPCPSVPTA
jgi:hypothetical protein